MTTAAPPETPPGRRRLRRAGLALGVLVAVLAAAWVGGYLLAGDKVPRGTTVAGIAIGGLAEGEAARRLEDGLRARAERPVPVTVDGRTTEAEPAELGLSVDYEATVAEAGVRKSWSPTLSLIHI